MEALVAQRKEERGKKDEIKGRNPEDPDSDKTQAEAHQTERRVDNPQDPGARQ